MTIATKLNMSKDNLLLFSKNLVQGSQGTQNAGNYKQISLQTFKKDTHGQAALTSAIKFITNQGENIGLLPKSSAWSLGSVNSVSEEVVKSATNYRINAVINSAQDDVFIVSLVVNSLKNSYQVLSYDYEYTDLVNNGNYQVNYTQGEPLLVQQVADSDDSDEGSIVVIKGPEQESSDDSDFENVGAFTPLTAADLSSPSIQQLINNGAQCTVQLAIANGTLPNGTYTVSNVNSALQQVVAGMNYEFNVQIAGGALQLDADITFDAYQGLDGSVQYFDPVVVSRIAVDSNFGAQP